METEARNIVKLEKSGKGKFAEIMKNMNDFED